MQQFDAQRHRGTEGFGLFDGKQMNIVKAAKENKILKWLVKYNSDMILFHHRYPTSTPNTKRSAHPFSTGDYFGKTTYVLVQNGNVKNADDLFCDHQELGIEYKTLDPDLQFNDSEALLWDFALFIEGKQKEPKAIGDMAFICIKLVNNKPERMFFYRNPGRPLKMFKTKEGLMLSSEGEGEVVPIDTLYNWNYKKKRLTKRKLEFLQYKPWKSSSVCSSDSRDTTGYNYYDYEYDYDAMGNYVGVGLGGYNWKGDPSPNLNEDQRYEDWWGNKTPTDTAPVKAGAILTGHLKEKFKDFFDNDGQVKTAPLVDRADKSQQTFDRTKGGLYIPKAERKQLEMGFVLKKGEHPDDEEVATELLAYLASVKGHFEQAMWAIEMDYEDLENVAQTKEVIRKKVLLDQCLKRLDDDPEYINSESISSTWSELWEAHKLATV